MMKQFIYLKKALYESSNDAEIYYYLGWFNHYRAYDSRPLKGYDYSDSEQIFRIEINIRSTTIVREFVLPNHYNIIHMTTNIY